MYDVMIVEELCLRHDLNNTSTRILVSSIEQKEKQTNVGNTIFLSLECVFSSSSVSFIYISPLDYGACVSVCV